MDHGRVDDDDRNQEDQEMMEIVEKNSLIISTGNRSRFPITEYGYTFKLSTPYELPDFTHVLRKYMYLERFVNDPSTSISNDDDDDGTIDSQQIDLFQALFFPRSLAPQTSMSDKKITMMNESSISAMWFRLVSHFFEWLTGVSELQYLCDKDKIKLVVCQLCKVVCFSVVYANYEGNYGEEDRQILFFGSGFFWDAARTNDPLMDEYCKQMLKVLNTYILPPVRRLAMTNEEFVLIKLVALFDCSDFIDLTRDGRDFCRSMFNKYRTILSQYVRHNIQQHNSHLTSSEIDKISMKRVRQLLDVPKSVEIMGELDDSSLADMVKTNYGGMNGTLQNQIHTESRRKD